MFKQFKSRMLLHKYPGMVLLVITGSVVLAACAGASSSSATLNHATGIKSTVVLTRSVTGVQRCHAAQLELKMARNAHGAAYVTPYGSGQANLIMEFVNTSSSTCELTGVPAPEMTTGNGSSSPVPANHQSVTSSIATSPGEPAVKIFDAPVELPPDQSAAFAVNTNYGPLSYIPPGSTHILSRSDNQAPSQPPSGNPGYIAISPVFPTSLINAILDTIDTGYPGSNIGPLSSGPGQTIRQLASYEHWSQSQVTSLWQAEIDVLHSTSCTTPSCFTKYNYLK
jgi:hypothetical protein